MTPSEDVYRDALKKMMDDWKYNNYTGRCGHYCPANIANALCRRGEWCTIYLRSKNMCPCFYYGKTGAIRIANSWLDEGWSDRTNHAYLIHKKHVLYTLDDITRYTRYPILVIGKVYYAPHTTDLEYFGNEYTNTQSHDASRLFYDEKGSLRRHLIKNWMVVEVIEDDAIHPELEVNCQKVKIYRRGYVY